MDYLSKQAKLHHLFSSLLCFFALTFATQANLVLASATSQPPKSSTSASTPAMAPSRSPVTHGNFTRTHSFKHHKRHPHAATPPSFALPLTPAICDEVSCADPLTLTPIGSPCACVLPIQVEIDLDVAPYQLFSSIAELELEVAAGTFLKQSQVRIMGASPNTEDPGKTTVTIDLVPLGDKFDNMTALLTFQRFWQKTVQINSSIFGDYNVVYVRYPGLPLSPPPISSEYLGPSGSRENPLTADVPTTKMQKMNIKVIVMIALFSSILVLMCFIFVYIFGKCKRVGSATTNLGPPLTWLVTRKKGVKPIVSHSTSTSTSLSFISTIATYPSSVKSFSLSELEKATNKFSSKKVLGEGGFGRVYLGVLEDKREVAIKLLTREDRGDREFIAEVEMLSRLHHRNLVKLIGICIEGRRRCLVYELIRNGSVESHLHGPDKMKRPLDWDTRMKIALGAARGLAYLHEDSNPRVIHRDFKTSNVLLEEDFTPKVSDFGLAREATDGTHHISTRVMGTFGYVAPEYAMTGHLLVKSDVYSYGVVLLELLSGRKPVDISRPNGSENLVTWARPLLTTKEGLDQLIDPSLPSNTDFDTIAKVAAIASLCVHIEASQRPFMGEVVQALKLIYNYTDEACEDCCSSPVQSTSNGSTPCLFDYSCTMEYSSGDIERLDIENRSGPLRIKKEKNAFRRLRGSESEPESRQCRRSCMESDWV